MSSSLKLSVGRHLQLCRIWWCLSCRSRQWPIPFYHGREIPRRWRPPSLWRPPGDCRCSGGSPTDWREQAGRCQRLAVNKKTDQTRAEGVTQQTNLAYWMALKVFVESPDICVTLDVALSRSSLVVYSSSVNSNLGLTLYWIMLTWREEENKQPPRSTPDVWAPRRCYLCALRPDVKARY